MEAQMRLRDVKEYILVLVDHMSKINIISKRVYEMGK